MKFILSICILIFFLESTFAKEMPKKATTCDSSLACREELKKNPRLGMSFKQLKTLWGDSPDVSDGTATWEDVGGLRLRASFFPLFICENIDDNGLVVNPDKSRCESIKFSYADGKVLLTPENAAKIAEVLLPGVMFNLSAYSQQDLVFEKLKCPSSDKEKTYELQGGEEGVYIISFKNNQKTIKIETDKL